MGLGKASILVHTTIDFTGAEWLIVSSLLYHVVKIGILPRARQEVFETVDFYRFMSIHSNMQFFTQAVFPKEIFFFGKKAGPHTGLESTSSLPKKPMKPITCISSLVVDRQHMHDPISAVTPFS